MQFTNLLALSAVVSAGFTYQECYDSAKKFRVGIVFKNGQQCKYTNSAGTWAACSTYGRWCGDDNLVWNCQGEYVKLQDNCATIAAGNVPPGHPSWALGGRYANENGCDKYYF
ncbi:hypothetical protein BC833DRAFT_580273, partial [Globomyces pollinis-pini]